MNSIVNEQNLIVLLPYATPHQNFKFPWGAYHPAAALYQKDQGATLINEATDYVAYSSVHVASCLSHTVVATIPSKTTISGMMLDHVLSTFVNPENILAEVERLECDETTIAGQIKAAFDFYQHATRVLVIWPYQVFPNRNIIAADGDAKFAYSHPMLNVKPSKIPECVVVSAVVASNGNGDDIECHDVQEYKELDTLLKGHYTRVLSMVELNRDEFFDFTSSPTYPNLTLLIKKTLVGKRGVMVGQGHQFI